MRPNDDKMYRKLYTQHNSLKFTDSVKLNIANVIFRARNHSLPSNLQNIFKVKAYDTLLFYIIRIRTKRKMFIYLPSKQYIRRFWTPCA